MADRQRQDPLVPGSLADAELIAQALAAGSQDARLQVARELFFRHFDLISRTISSTLAAFSLPAGDSYEKRGELDTHVLDSLFLQPGLTRLSQFQPGAGSFTGWLRQVVRNLVISWLRKQEDRPLGLDARGGEDSSPPTSVRGSVEDDADPSSNDSFPRMDKVLAELSDAQRAVALFRLLPYRSWVQGDAELVAKLASKSPEETRSAADLMLDRFTSGQEYVDYWLAEQQLETEQRRLLTYRRRAGKLETYVGALVLSHRTAIEKLVGLQRKQIEALSVVELRKAKIPVESPAQAEAVRNWLVALWLVARTEHRLSQLQTKARGQSPPLLGYEDVAEFLGMSAKQVRNHFDAAKRRLGPLLGDGDDEP